MRFYRIHKGLKGGSAGFEWYTDRDEADRAAKRWIDANDGELVGVKIVDIAPTKTGIKKALMAYASHPFFGRAALDKADNL